MKKISVVALGFLYVVGVFGTSGTMAQWPDDPSLNLLLSDRSGEQTITKVVPTSDGGCYVSWWDNTSGNYDFYLQRVDSSGTVQWVEDGLSISHQPQQTWLTDYGLAVDSLDHAIIAINDIRAGGDWDVYGYRISPAGDFVWGPDGLTISDNANAEYMPYAIVTTAGNIVFTWQDDNNLYLRKVTAAGADVWDPAIITIAYTYPLSIPRLAQTPDDGIILQYLKATGPNYYNPKHLYAHKYDASGNNLWGANGVVVSDAGGFGPQMRPDIVSDERGGAFSWWYDSRDMNLHAYAQHINSDGSMAWAADGVLAITTMGQLQMSPACVYLSATNELVLFVENTNGDQTTFGLYAQKLDSTGARGWTSYGQTLVPMNAQQKMLLQGCRIEGDAVVVYLESTPGSVVNSLAKAIRVSPAGVQVWDPSPATLSTVVSGKGYLDACANGAGQVIAVWADKRYSPSADVYLQNINPDGSLGPLGPSGCVYIPGDINGNGQTNGIDVGYGVNYFKGGPTPPIQCDMCPEPNPFYAAGDVNGNCVFNGIDVTFFVNYLKGIVPAILYCPTCPPAM